MHPELSKCCNIKRPNKVLAMHALKGQNAQLSRFSIYHNLTRTLFTSISRPTRRDLSHFYSARQSAFSKQKAFKMSQIFFKFTPYLPDTNNSIGDEDEQDDKGFNKGGDRVVIFKEGEDEGDDGGEEKNLDKEVIKLFQDKLENCLSSLYRQL